MNCWYGTHNRTKGTPGAQWKAQSWPTDQGLNLLLYLLAPWTKYSTSPRLSFLIYKMGKQWCLSHRWLWGWMEQRMQNAKHCVAHSMVKVYYSLLSPLCAELKKAFSCQPLPVLLNYIHILSTYCGDWKQKASTNYFHYFLIGGWHTSGKKITSRYLFSQLFSPLVGGMNSW